MATVLAALTGAMLVACTNYDWSDEVRGLQMLVLLVYADHDAISTKHIAEFFALLGGASRIRDGRTRVH